MDNGHTAALILTMAAVTAALRFLPFFLLGGRRRTPAFVSYLGRVLPYAIMGMLVVYCLKDAAAAAPAVWLLRYPARRKRTSPAERCRKYSPTGLPCRRRQR